MAKLSENDLNDFLNPGAVCIKPAEVKKSEKSHEDNEIQVQGNSYFEVTKDTGESKELEVASISLNDCLACSGCITSAETVLVNLQSYQEVLKQLDARTDDQELFYVSSSPQVRANLAAYYGLSLQEMQDVLEMVFVGKLGFCTVLDTNAAREIVLQQCALEFCESWKQRQQENSSENGSEKAIGLNSSDLQKDSINNVASSKPDAHAKLPMLSSSCPGWICYVEKTHSALIPHLSRVRSPQQACGRLLKDWASKQYSLERKQVWHLSLMPCFDKKLEASRDEFSEDGVRDVDAVLTPKEIVEMFKYLDLDPRSIVKNRIPYKISNEVLPAWYPRLTFEEQGGSSSGGYMSYVMSYAAEMLFGIHDANSFVTKVDQNGDLTEYILRDPRSDETLLTMSTCYGFRNIQNLVRKVNGKNSNRRGQVLLKRRMKNDSQKIQQRNRQYDYVEVMACPGGCINGGGQLPFPSGERILASREWMNQVESLYYSPGKKEVDRSFVNDILEQWIRDPQLAPNYLQATYRSVETDLSNPLLLANKW
ncbi:iron hydrogenase [Schizosaccharomyces cryophilus OY26]|uniref:Cytosolic Fe-S cluster assembly factor NAR1 n=1 Tax=Schizosaccharomyces cryophilus (strain OY26 / ATCC MYA-4695 / CBS 11777 / NBRC 106824 / NRRL Y48691) TaxID=653667 RepID=S9W1W0_SCHCR|nr:iron hydrogenase [Schizosaccharomyces cryophilus OY26]EPY52015.1 iron hydrogenase [Schizosaccharomyces cryophilus OY26]